MSSLEISAQFTYVNECRKGPGAAFSLFRNPVEDSMDSIFDAVKYTALSIRAERYGFSFSRIRPARDRWIDRGVPAPAVVHEGFRYSHRCYQTRRYEACANMAILNIDHPISLISSVQGGYEGADQLQPVCSSHQRLHETVEKGEEYKLVNPIPGRRLGS